MKRHILGRAISPAGPFRALAVYAILVSISLIPTVSISAPIPQALIVLFSNASGDETWKVLTDLESPMGSEMGPSTDADCMASGMTRIAFWLREHLPNWNVKEWRCVPVQDVDSFLATHQSARL